MGVVPGREITFREITGLEITDLEITGPDPAISPEVESGSQDSPLTVAVDAFLEVDANRDRGAIMTAISRGKKEVPN
jgi:hypothetical protein